MKQKYTVVYQEHSNTGSSYVNTKTSYSYIKIEPENLKTYVKSEFEYPQFVVLGWIKPADIDFTS